MQVRTGLNTVRLWHFNLHFGGPQALQSGSKQPEIAEGRRQVAPFAEELRVHRMPEFSLSADTWDLHRRADRDRQRHNEKIKEVIKRNLGDIISQQDIITADQGKIVKIPVRGLELPRIRFDDQERERVGQGTGGTKPGDVLGRAPQQNGQGTGKEAGHEAGVDFYEA